MRRFNLELGYKGPISTETFNVTVLLRRIKIYGGRHVKICFSLTNAFKTFLIRLK